MAVRLVRVVVVVERLIDLSIVVPIYNERHNIASFSENISRYAKYVTEVIIVDGGSTDGSIALLRKQLCDSPNVSIMNAELGRANQMNAGAAQACSHLLLFLHADTQLPVEAFEELSELVSRKVIWGRFDVTLNNSGAAYRLISWFINKRSALTGIATGDQAMFVRRSVFESEHGFPSQLLMEDIELSKTLKSYAKPWCSKLTVTTSARKWEAGGIIRTIFLMWRLRAAYYFGASPESL